MPLVTSTRQASMLLPSALYTVLSISSAADTGITPIAPPQPMCVIVSRYSENCLQQFSTTVVSTESVKAYAMVNLKKTVSTCIQMFCDEAVGKLLLDDYDM